MAGQPEGWAEESFGWEGGVRGLAKKGNWGRRRGLGHCKRMISSAAVRQPAPPHVKEEQIKASAFDEYKTESPAEKPSCSNHTAAATTPAPAAIPPTLSQIKRMGGARRGGRTTQTIVTKACCRIVINILLLQKSEA